MTNRGCADVICTGPLVAAMLVLWAGCLETEAMQCQDGTWCQPGWVCSVAFGPKLVCVPEDGCGNGKMDRGEICDDGNIIPGDGCSADCTRLEHCGNGRVDDGEVCDDGNARSGDGCREDCV
jgi:cysteine-rich repeat protein